MMGQRSVILLLLIILAGCSEEDDLGGVAKVSGTLPLIGSQIDPDGVLVVTFDEGSNIENGAVAVDGKFLSLSGNQVTIDYSSLAMGKVAIFIISWKNTDGTIGTFNASFHVNEKKLAQEIIWEKDNAKMVLIPAGSFEMGDITWHVSQPVHPVELDAFYMDVHEVTVGHFMEFVDQSDYKYGDRGDNAASWTFLDEVAEHSPGDEYPMIWVTWHDATAYAKWAGKRLPTEAEWEYAARGGLIGKRYPWGDDESVARDHANYEGTGGKDQWSDTTAPVGSFRPNGYGLYDMLGNVSEWCSDLYDPFYYSKSPLKNPTGPSSGTKPWQSFRVLRGSSWFFSGGSVAYRNKYNADRSDIRSLTSRTNGFVGFRCVMDVEE